MAKAKGDSENTKGDGQTVSAYFRNIFAENPGLLEGRSNQELLDRWLKDHPDETKVPQKIKANLSNIKSVLRQKARKKKGGRPPKAQAAEPTRVEMAEHSSPKRASATNNTPLTPLEQLEEQIDECLTLAKTLDRDRLSHVISMLRHARNLVVWEEGR
jgi:hypothetical protein